MCFIQDLALWSTIGLGREINGLYLLDENNSASLSLPVVFFVIEVQPHVWPSRLGHLSNAKLALINNNNVPLFNSNEIFHCDVCLLAKQKSCFLILALMFLMNVLISHIMIFGVPFQFLQLMVVNTF